VPARLTRADIRARHTGYRCQQRGWLARRRSTATRLWYLLGTLAPLQTPCKTQKPRLSRAFTRVSDGTRTRDRLDHNQELYQLSYAHRAALNLAALAGVEGAQQPPAIIRP
jgi:hypothetical protein